MKTTKSQKTRRDRMAHIERGNAALSHALRHLSIAIQCAKSTKQPANKLLSLDITKERIQRMILY